MLVHAVYWCVVVVTIVVGVTVVSTFSVCFLAAQARAAPDGILREESRLQETGPKVPAMGSGCPVAAGRAKGLDIGPRGRIYIYIYIYIYI